MRTSVLIIAALAAGCGGGDPVDAEGQYSISLTNRDNGCDLMNWDEGNTSQNIPFEIQQSGNAVTGTVGGVAGGILEVWLGSRVFDGFVEGSSITMELFGSTSFSSGNCVFTYNALIDATLDGDVLIGTIDYTAATNGNPDCADLDGCASVQEFNGTRPPQ